jgi:hypothetical protein
LAGDCFRPGPVRDGGEEFPYSANAEIPAEMTIAEVEMAMAEPLPMPIPSDIDVIPEEAVLTEARQKCRKLLKRSWAGMY